MSRRKTSDRIARMEPKELLGLFRQAALMVEAARGEAGPVAPAKGPRGLKRRQRKDRHRRNEARRLQITSRSATVVMQTQGFYIEPRTRRDPLDFLRRIG